MTASGLERARQALHLGNPAALLGERECDWLDVKSGVYRLDQPRGSEELAKDVAAFANTAAGGLLLVGFATRKEHGEEIVDALKPVPRALVDLHKHRQVIATRVMPALRDVSVERISCDDSVGVLVIDVPAQPRSSQLFAVPAPTGTAEVSKTAVGVDRTASPTAPPRLLHGLVQAGGGPEVFAWGVVHDHRGERGDGEAGAQSEQQERAEQPVEVAAVGCEVGHPHQARQEADHAERADRAFPVAGHQPASDSSSAFPAMSSRWRPLPSFSGYRSQLPRGLSVICFEPISLSTRPVDGCLIWTHSARVRAPSVLMAVSIAATGALPNQRGLSASAC